MKKYLEYLPEFLREYREIGTIAKEENMIIADEEENLSNCMSRPWVASCDETGIKRYENMFGISANTSDSLETRKNAIKIQLNRTFVYTYKNFAEYLDTICGKDGYSLDVQNASYTVNIKLALKEATLYELVSKNAREIVPANLVLNVQIMYNTYLIASVYLHNNLAAYTYKNIREKEITS